jgi:hypothetical protein
MTSRSLHSALAAALNPPPWMSSARREAFRRRSIASSITAPNPRCSSAAVLPVLAERTLEVPAAP